MRQILIIMIKYAQVKKLKTLKYTLLTQNQEEKVKLVNYIEKENVITFCVDDELFKFDSSSDILSKTNKEAIITIRFKERLIIIELLTEKYQLSMPIDDYNILKTDNIIRLEYSFMSDVKTTNCINIELL